jgi:hypothetical protein
MGDDIKKVIFSLSGLSIVLGALGFLSGIVQLFIDINKAVSIKWLLLVVWVALSLVLTLLKIIYDLHLQSHQPNHEAPIRVIDNGSIIVIRKNDNFTNSIIVGCYYVFDEVERLASVGVVHHVQERIIQIRVVKSLLSEKEVGESTLSVGKLIVRPVVPYEVLNRIAGERE